MKRVMDIFDPPRLHWVGDGFPVRSLFSYPAHGEALSPFLLLDYAAPTEFPPATRPRGVGEHPHRGFETVTLVTHGEVAHRDSTGEGGVIGPGDVQWMTAASGILHQEFHSEAFTRKGGTLGMVQLWVNLPAKDKMSAPGYQAIQSAAIPRVALAGDAGFLRIIAGEYAGKAGPARTFTPMHVWDLQMKAGAQVDLPAREGWTTALVTLRGRIRVAGGPEVEGGRLILMERSGAGVSIEAAEDAALLFLSGEPIDEPIVGRGPFVMNTEAEIRQALEDFERGRFGRIPG